MQGTFTGEDGIHGGIWEKLRPARREEEEEREREKRFPRWQLGNVWGGSVYLLKFRFIVI